MTRLLRKVSKKFFIVSNIVTVVAFILVCCTGFLNPGKYWYVAVLGVGFPFIVLVLLLFIFFWWFFKSRWALLSFAAIILGWWQVHALFGLHLFASFDIAKPADALRVMQWNVARMDQMNPKRPGGTFRKSILEFVGKMNPDVLCMEEFLESNNPREFAENIPYITDTLKFPYHYFARDYRRWDGAYEHGVIIFSKYPFVDTLRIRYSGPDSLRATESLIHTDIAVNGQRIRIFATHLQSLRFDGNDYTAIKTVAKAGSGAVNKSKGVLKKFQQAYMLRSRQAELVRREMDDSPYPAIICGDFNDIPNSFTYAKIKGDRNDAFLKCGFGIGRSFASISPTLRIDFILADKKLEVLQFKKTKLYYSDHYPLVADFKIPEKE
jgi:endonuclease/exonuclease/phosphatase family metal-dependent hydrolase